MIATFNEKGVPIPFRFRMDNENSFIKFEKLIHMERVNDPYKPKQHCYIFLWRSVINDLLRNYELKFEIEECKWLLYRMWWNSCISKQ